MWQVVYHIKFKRLLTPAFDKSKRELECSMLKGRAFTRNRTEKIAILPLENKMHVEIVATICEKGLTRVSFNDYLWLVDCAESIITVFRISIRAEDVD